MRVSFSGTREGMSERQLALLEAWFKKYKDQVSLFSHGCCMGSDMQAHALIRKIIGRKVFIAVFPSTSTRTRRPAPLDSNFVAKPEPPLIRDKKILAVGKDMLVAAPLTILEVQRSGTWTNIRHAKRINMPYYVLER